MSSDKTASLMASLTGDLGGAAGGAAADGTEDQDLFGDIPIDDPVPAPVPAPVPTPVPAAQTQLNDSVYHDPMSSSGMQQQQQQQQVQEPNSMPPNSNSNPYPYPQPPQQQLANAPNVTYVDPSTGTGTNNGNGNTNTNTSSSINTMAQSQPVLPSSVPATTATATAPAPTNMSKSLLLNSGLLGVGSSDEKKADASGGAGGGGGLFDDIDQEEEQKAQAAAAAEAERKRQEEAAALEQKRQEEERQKQEEQQRLQQQQQQQQMQQQQQQMQQQQMQQQQMQQQPQQNQQFSLEARMQGMHLNAGQNSYLQQSQQMQQSAAQMNHQQQQQQQQQQMPGQMNTGQPGQMMNANPSGQLMGQSNMNMQQPAQQQNQQQHMQQPGQMNQSNMQQKQTPGQANVPGVMYRQHPGEMNGNPSAQQQPNTSTMQQKQQSNATSPHRFYTPTTPGVVTAGMHNASPQQPNSPYRGGMQQHQQQQRAPGQPIPITKPPEVPTYYGKVTCNDPMLLQAPAKLLGMVSSPPHWSYQFTTQIKGQPPSVWIVRRRFRHVVALEDRLRMEVPGAILPPRPDKHVSRAIEEASTHQSAEFAWQRAAELERYLNALVTHPEAFGTEALKMFLGLSDDMGTAWPEVSANAFTRMSAMGSSAAANLSTTGGFFGSTAAPAATTPNQSAGVMSNVMGSVASSVGVGELAEAATEDSAELLALSSSESVRMGAVLQAVPKLEGAVTLLREQGEGAGAVGMELNRLAKEVLAQGDRELSMPLEIFSNGLLRYGRRTKRLGQEIGQATMTSFQLQYKLCRYEKQAWSDRRNALTKRLKERGRADKRAQQLMGYQHQYPPHGGGYGGGGYGGGYGGQPNMNQQYNGNQMNQMMTNATMSDNMAVEAVRECDEIGERLKREVNRISFSRRMDWSKSVKVIASYMKEAAAERVAIWESTRDTFLQAFPEYNNDTAQWTNVTPIRPDQQMQYPPQPQMQQQQQMNMGMNANTGMNSSYMVQPGGMMSQSYQQAPTPQQPQAYNSMMGSSMVGSMTGQASMGGAYQQH